MDNITDNIKDLMISIVESEDFVTLFYDTFFLISPDSKKRFRNFRRQMMLLQRILVIVFTYPLDGEAKDRKRFLKEHKSAFSRMKTAHKAHNIKEEEYDNWVLSFKICCLATMRHMDGYHKNKDLVLGYIDDIFQELKDIVI